ncbi:MAG TPA: hypothetical protein VKE41_13480 [Roseiflexaceae bacterium]|nr:hypothetical protein [Roseiflexaceae bacterium]
MDAVNRIATEIGARRPTSLGEAQAAAYLDGRMRRAGLRVSADAFRAAAGPGWDGVVLALLATIGVVLYYWLPLPSLALGLWNLATAGVALARPGAPLLARKRQSQNVIATRAIDEPPRWRVVLLAPLDSPPATSALTRRLTAGRRAALGRVAACGLIVLLALLALGGPLELRRVFWYLQIAGAAYLLLLAAFEIWTVLASATPGAINHAGALAALLESADSLNGLSRTELWAVALGASSSGVGLADLLRRYPFDREMTLFIGIESIGAGRLSYITRTGIFPQRPGDTLLLSLVAGADADDPLIDAEPRPYASEPVLVHQLETTGRRALTIIGLDGDGRPAYRGSMADTPEHVDDRALDRAIRLIVGLVKKIDSTSSEV